MNPSRGCALLLWCLLLINLEAVAQNEQQFQSYIEQGERYEKQGDYLKALDAYRKAQPYSSLTSRKSIDRTITHLEDLIQQQVLVNQALADGIQRKIATISSPQNRKRLHEDLTRLQQRTNATKADYQSLARRVKVAEQVEDDINENEIVSNPIRRSTSQHQRTSSPRPSAGPPPKSITNRMPGSTAGETHRNKNDAKITKSASQFLHGVGKSN